MREHTHGYLGRSNSQAENAENTSFNEVDATHSSICPLCQGAAKGGVFVLHFDEGTLKMMSCGTCKSTFVTTPKSMIAPAPVEGTCRDASDLLADLGPLLAIRHPNRSRLLEVGRGAGVLSRFWQCSGFGPAVAREPLEALSQTDGTFDYVLGHRVIDQLDEPAAWLAAMSTALSQDGILVLSTPGIGTPTTDPARKKHLPNPPRFVASQEGLAALLSNCGFEHVVLHDLGETIEAWASHSPLPQLAERPGDWDLYLDRLGGMENALQVGNALWREASNASAKGDQSSAKKLCQALLGFTRMAYDLDLEDLAAVLSRRRKALLPDMLPPWLGQTLYLMGLIAQDEGAPAERQINLFRAAIEVLHAEQGEGGLVEQDRLQQLTAARTALVRVAALLKSSSSETEDPLPKYVLRHPGPVANKDLCLFTIYSPTGEVSGITKDYVDLMAEHGFAVIACLAVEDVTAPVDFAALKSAAGIVVRQNGGMDFSCWSASLGLLPEIWTASRVVFTNDSIIALPAIFASFAARLRASRADLTGLTESLRPRHHIQSYFFMLQGKALVEPKVQEFWSTLQVLDRKSDIIDQYETRLLERAVKDWQLTCEIMFSGPALGLVLEWDRNNSSHFHWEKLIAAGMPFVKVELLRDNPLGLEISNWREFLGAHGVDCAKAEAHFAIKRGTAPRIKQRKSKVMALLSQINHARLRLQRKLRRKPRRLV